MSKNTSFSYRTPLVATSKVSVNDLMVKNYFGVARTFKNFHDLETVCLGLFLQKDRRVVHRVTSDKERKRVVRRTAASDNE